MAQVAGQQDLRGGRSVQQADRQKGIILVANQIGDSHCCVASFGTHSVEPSSLRGGLTLHDSTANENITQKTVCQFYHNVKSTNVRLTLHELCGKSRLWVGRLDYDYFIVKRRPILNDSRFHGPIWRSRFFNQAPGPCTYFNEVRVLCFQFRFLRMPWTL